MKEEEAVAAAAALAAVAMAVSGSSAGREASYGTVSKSFLSGAARESIDDANGDGNYPRQSEESIYFSSTASAMLGPEYPSSRGSVTSVNHTDGAGGDGGSSSSVNFGIGRNSASASSSVTIAHVDPGVLVRPPIVDDGKLKHDRERRLGVASDLEAVVAVRTTDCFRLKAGRGACLTRCRLGMLFLPLNAVPLRD